MTCLKCGREIAENEMFCEECLEFMEKYPVKPGIAIMLPHREETVPVKKQVSRRKQPLSTEEMVIALRRRVRSLIVLWVVTLLLLGLTIYPTIDFIRDLDGLLPGQNYSTMTTETAEP